MGGQSTPATTTQIQKVELPAWVEQASQENYQFAKDVVHGKPYENNPLTSVVGLSQGERDASTILQQGIGNSSALQAAAARFMGSAGDYTPQMVTAGSVPAYQAAGAVSGGNGYLGVNAPQAARDVALSQGAAAIKDVQGVQDVAAQRFDGANLGGYLSPYTGAVVDTTLAGMRDNLALSAQKVDDAARGSGAWGGSRSGVQAAVLQSQGAKDMAATEAGLRSAAYTDAAGRLMQDNQSALQAALANQNSALTTQGRNVDIAKTNQASTLATNALNADIGKANQNSALTTAAQRLAADTTNSNNYLSNADQRLRADLANQSSTNENNRLNAGILTGNRDSALQASLANQSAGGTAANLRLQAGNALGGLGSTVSNDAGKNSLLSAQLGSNERAIAQAKADLEAQKWQNNADSGLNALNVRLAALGMSPYGKTTTTNETKSGGTSSNTGMQIAGGIMSLLPLMFSDERLKKNIRTEGTTDAGVPLKSYEYRGFMGKARPGRQLGVMAQDLEKVDPGAVHRVPGPDGKEYRAVDYSRVGRGFMGRNRKAA